VSPIGGSIELKPPTKSAHQQDNRGGHVPPEEAEPYNGGKFIETPNLTSQSPYRNTPPTLSCQRSWAIGGPTTLAEAQLRWQAIDQATNYVSSPPREWRRRKSLQIHQFLMKLPLKLYCKYTYRSHYSKT